MSLTIVEIWIPRAGYDWITQNQTRRWHWRKLAKVQRDWKESTNLAVAIARLVRHEYPPCVIDSTFFFKENRRRDPHNFTATLKPIVDQLVHLGFWPDDTPEWVTINQPVFEVGPTPGIRIRLTPMAADILTTKEKP